MVRRDKQADGPASDLMLAKATNGERNGKPQKRRARKDGWTMERRARFLEALSECCNVLEACRAAEISRNNAYALRRRDPGFAAEWAEALEQGYAELEMMLLRQSIFGSTTTETVEDGTETGRARIKTVHSYPHTTALRLLLAHRSGVEAFRDSQGIERPGSAAVREDIMRRIEEVRERLKRRAEADTGGDGAA